MKISVIGLGVIGASIATRLKDKYEVCGIDIDENTISYVKEKKLGFHASKDVSISYDSDVIILALYPSKVLPWLKNNGHRLKEKVLILDTSGVKEEIMSAVQSILREDINCIGFHPMAGKERSGIEFNSYHMFDGANIIVVSEKDYHNPIIDELGYALGARVISHLTASEHDELIGYLSQLTHVIAIALMNSYNHPLLVDYTGDSFRDLTRIARINEYLWTELFMMNSFALVKHIELFEKQIKEFKEALINKDNELMYEKMRESSKRRALFDKK